MVVESLVLTWLQKREHTQTDDEVSAKIRVRDESTTTMLWYHT